MADFNSYIDFSFYNMLVNDYLANNIYAVTGNGKVYYDDGSGVQTFSSEEKALNYLLRTFDISGHYKFFDVFYNVQNTSDGFMKYKDYMCIITRKTKKTKNQVISFLINPLKDDNIHNGRLIEDNYDMELITKSTPYNSIEKDVSRLFGMELDILCNCQIEDNLWDIRDNFIVDEYMPEAKNENKITCNILFNHIMKCYKLATTYINASDKSKIFPQAALIDVMGCPIKTTGLFGEEDKVIINDSLDIYREFIGGTTKSEEDFPSDEEESEKDCKNDSEYI